MLLAQFVALRDELKRALGFVASRVSMMVARYPGGGARYARHLDAIPEHKGAKRRLTVIYYANPDWNPDDGGCLRTYFPESVGSKIPGAQKSVEAVRGGVSEVPRPWLFDVEPRLDRLVLFASEWLEHEVLPSYAERHSVTGWFY